MLLICLFLPWYGVDVDVGVISGSDSASAWEALSFIDILLFLIAVMAILYAAGAAAGTLPPDVPAGTAVMAAGGLALLLVLFRIIDLPTPDEFDIEGVDFSRKIGIFIALIASAGIVYGGWRSSAEETTAAAPPEPTAPPPAV